jgi:hypothetical protein
MYQINNQAYEEDNDFTDGSDDVCSHPRSGD